MGTAFWQDIKVRWQRAQSENFSSYLKEFAVEICIVLVMLCILSLTLIVTFPASYVELNPFVIRIRGSLAFLLIGLLLLSFWATILFIRETWNQIFSFLELNLIQFFGLSYFLSIELQAFKIVGMILLSGLVGVVYWYILRGNKFPYFLVAGIVLLLSLQSFSLVSLLRYESLGETIFNSDLFENPLFVNEYTWLLLSALGISIISIRNLQLSNWRHNLLFGGIFLLILGQFFFLLNSTNIYNFQYWQKTLTLLTLWDFLIQPITSIAKRIPDDRFTPRMLVFTAYHSLVILIIFISVLIL